MSDQHTAPIKTPRQLITVVILAFVLNLMWLNKVCAFAREHGRIPIFWDDMIFNHAGVYRTSSRLTCAH